MNDRLPAFLCGILLLSIKFACAAEAWNCKFKDLTGALPKGFEGAAKVEINGAWLDWRIETSVSDRDGRPATDHHGAYQRQTETFRKRILENNGVGVVAASSQSQIDSQIGPLVSADVIVLDKRTGSFREGSLALGGAHDFMSGQCKRDSVSKFPSLKR